MKIRFLARSASTLLLLVASVVTARSQGFLGTIRGTVQDKTGAVIVGATVTVTNAATTETRTQKSGDAGTFDFPALLVSTYTVVVESPGFKRNTRRNVQVSANTISDVLTRMELGNVTEEVIVTTSEERLKVSTAQLEGITSRHVDDLPNPVLTGSPNNLAILAPGTTTQPGGVAGQGGSIGGNRPRSNSFSTDGADNNDPTTTGTLTPVIADAVEEFTLLTNQFRAEYGHSTAGQFITTTRSGTNDVHGRAWWYNQNRHTNSFDTLTRAVTKPGDPKPRYDWNRFGAQFGGPIIKEKWFFFSSYEYQNKTLAGTATAQFKVPTEAGLATLKSLASRSNSGLNPAIVDILARYVPVADTETESTTVTDEATGTSLPIPLGQFSATTPNFDRTHLFLANSDFKIGSHRLSGRYSYSRNPFIVPGALPVATFNTDASVNTQRIVFSDVFTLGLRAVNEFRAGYNRNLEDRSQNLPAPPGATDVFGNYGVDDMSLSIGPAATTTSRSTHLYQFSNNISFMSGRHILKFGAELRNIIAQSDFTPRARGEYSWSTLDDFVHDRFPGSVSIRGVGLGTFVQNRTAYYAFAQDSWKVHKRVTLEYGLRYEFTSTARDQRLQDLNGIANLVSVRDEVFTTDLVPPGDPRLGNVIFNTLPAYHQQAIVSHIGEQLLFRQPNPDNNNFAPRLGLAWDVFGDSTTSLRAGAGIAHDVLYGNLALLLTPPQIQAENRESNACTLIPSPAWCAFAVSNPVNPVTSPGIRYSNIGFIEGGALLPILPPGTRINRFTARNLSAAYVNPEERVPETYTWSLSAQRKQFKDWVFELRYVGNHAVHLPVQLLLNPNAPNPVRLPLFLNEADALNTNFTGAPTLAQFNAGKTKLLGPYGFNGALTTLAPVGQSWYHGGSISVDRSLTSGLHLNASYTWSKTTDLIENDVNTSALNPRRPQDPYNISSNKGLSGLHRAHKFVASWIYELPHYTGGGALGRLSEGWQFIGSYIAESGQPISILSGIDSNGDGDTAGDTAVFNPAGETNVGSDVDSVCWNGTATSIGASCSGAIVGYVARNPKAQYIRGRDGMVTNLGRNTFIMPGINTANLSLFRNVRFREKNTLQFRIEMYNAFNHPSYTLGTGTFLGQSSATSPARSTPGYSIPGSTQFLNPGVFSGGLGNAPFQRIIQWGLKILF